MEITKTNIKGTNYSVKLNNDLLILDDSLCVGLCDKQNKEITISKKNYEFRKDVTIRHELIHAFLYESGLANYSSDETLVDWMAFHIPQIEKVFNEIKTKIKQEESNVKNCKRKGT